MPAKKKPAAKKKTPKRPAEFYEGLTLDPKNLRVHNDRSKSVVRRSLEEVGPFRSIAVDGDGIVRAGNSTLEQAKELGLKVRIVKANANELIAVQRDDLRGDKAVRAAILDNRSGELSEWDYEGISKLLQDWQGQGIDVTGLGWADYELSPLLAASWEPPAVGDMPSSDHGSQGRPIAVTSQQRAIIDKVIEHIRKLKNDLAMSEGACLEVACSMLLQLLAKKK